MKDEREPRDRTLTRSETVGDQTRQDDSAPDLGRREEVRRNEERFSGEEARSGYSLGERDFAGENVAESQRERRPRPDREPDEAAGDEPDEGTGRRDLRGAAREDQTPGTRDPRRAT